MKNKDLLKRLCFLYFSIALDIASKNEGMVDDYEVKKFSTHDFDDISNYKLPILNFAKDLYSKHKTLMFAKSMSNSIVVFNAITKMPYLEFSFVLTQTLTFSGTIGVTEISRDFGLSKHIDYLSLFIERYKINNIVNSSDLRNQIYGGDFDELLTSYQHLYDALQKYFESDTMALYSLLTGIKNYYNVPDIGIHLSDDDTYQVLDMLRLKDHNLINDMPSRIEAISSKQTPMLKIDLDGNKILHIRTKTDKKNNTFKLRFFIETTTKFLNLFKTRRNI